MTVKVTMFFEAFRYSWSESHYLLNASDPNASGPAAAILATLRQNCLGYYAQLVAVRMSTVPASRIVADLLRSMWPPLGTNQAGEDTGELSTDAPFTCLLLHFGGVTSSKNLYLAGIPDINVEFTPPTPDGYSPSNDFNTALIAYTNELIGLGSPNNWGFPTQQQGLGTQAVGVTTETGYNNNIGVITEANPNVVTGGTAFTRGFRVANPRVPNITGTYYVLQVIQPGSGNPNWVTVLNGTQSVEENNFTRFGAIGPNVKNYEGYENWNLVRATHRKRGGSYALPRGRSRVRR